MASVGFFIVLRGPERHGLAAGWTRENIVTRYHESEADAIEEARRLARKHGVAFYVLKTCGVVTLPEAPTLYEPLGEPPGA